MLTWNYQSPRRGASTIEWPRGEFDACLGGRSIEGEPYLSDGGTTFSWFRARMLGGRTNHWARISLRFGPDDFKGRTRDGYGADWPISYDDIRPYYDRVDRLVGISGSRENFYNEPDGIFQPPSDPRCYEHLYKRGCEKLDIPVIPARTSILTEPINDRPACHYCGQCNRGCTTNANFSSGPVLIEPALETGNLTLCANVMVRKVTTDDEGRATGVSYADTETMQEQKVRADIVVLAASACEPARLLLNSTSNGHPNGLANFSDAVGKYLMDTLGIGVSGFFPQLVDQPAHNCDGTVIFHVYTPWWLCDEQDRLDFRRGYHVEIFGGRGMPGYRFRGIHRNNGMDTYAANDNRRGGGGYGQQLKEDSATRWAPHAWETTRRRRC